MGDRKFNQQELDDLLGAKIQVRLDAYMKWAWYLQELLLSHNHHPVRFQLFIKENNIPYPEEI